MCTPCRISPAALLAEARCILWAIASGALSVHVEALGKLEAVMLGFGPADLFINVLAYRMGSTLPPVEEPTRAALPLPP